MIIDNDRPISVLHIASGDLWAGAEVQLFTLAKALKNNTKSIVNIILLNHGTLEKKLLSKDFNVIVLDESKLYTLAILRELIRVIRQIQPDVIHTHRLKENILGSLAARLNGNIPTLRTVHGASEHSSSWLPISKSIILGLDFFCGRYLQSIIVSVSEDLAEKLKINFPSKKIRVIENGIDLEKLGNFSINQNLNNRVEIFKVGFAGRLVPVKRIDIIIKTARHILDNYPQDNIVFYIYGDGPARVELEELSHKLKTDKIVFFQGHCSDMVHEIQRMDTLLITSDHEGLPMVLLEAMALGTPIISHAVGGIPYVLNQGNCGILIAENKPRNYAHAIKQLVDSPEKFLRISKLAIQRVNERYTSKANALAYYAQYKSLLEGSKP